MEEESDAIYWYKRGKAEGELEGIVETWHICRLPGLPVNIRQEIDDKVKKHQKKVYKFHKKYL